jgi:hypothetical protein
MILPRMDERALIRAAQITLRRAILENFPPGPERENRLEWLARAVSSRQELMRALKPLAPNQPDKAEQRRSPLLRRVTRGERIRSTQRRGLISTPQLPDDATELDAQRHH